MKSWKLNNWGREHLVLSDSSIPKILSPNEVLIQIKAISLNYRDLIMIEGGYGKMGGTPPIVPISDGAAKIVDKGINVKNFSIGDSVIPSFFQGWFSGNPDQSVLQTALGGPLDGVAQEFMILPENGILHSPKYWNTNMSSTLPCAGLTAWKSLVGYGNIDKSNTVLIQGTGGVAIFGLQIAKALGAKVVIISGNDEKLEFASSLGADFLINYNKNSKWSKDIIDYTDGKGVDIILELGGKDTFSQSIRSLKVSGLIALIGVLGGGIAELPIGLAISKSARIQSVTCGSSTDLMSFIHFLQKSGIKPVISKTYEFSDMMQGIKYMEKGHHIGKIVITV